MLSNELSSSVVRLETVGGLVAAADNEEGELISPEMEVVGHALLLLLLLLLSI